jgi:hypothetical protein
MLESEGSVSQSCSKYPHLNIGKRNRRKAGQGEGREGKIVAFYYMICIYNIIFIPTFPLPSGDDTNNIVAVIRRGLGNNDKI